MKTDGGIFLAELISRHRRGSGQQTQTTATQLTRRRARTNGICTSTALSVQGAHAAAHCVRDSRRRRRNVARSLDDGPQPGAHISMPPWRDRARYPLRSCDSPPCVDAERVRKRKARRRATIPMLSGEHERPGKLGWSGSADPAQAWCLPNV